VTEIHAVKSAFSEFCLLVEIMCCR